MNTLTKDGQRNLNLEALYHRFETAFGNIKSKVVSGTPLSNSDHEAIVAFVAAQLIRTPKFRGRWQFRSVGDHEGQLETISDPLLRSGIKKTLADIAKNSSQLLSFSALPKAIEILGNMRMVLLKTDDHLGFITSDSPCCVVQYADKVSAVFECLGSPTANVLMSLSPNILAIFDHSPGQHEMVALFPNHSRLHEANAILWNGAVKEVILRCPMLNQEWFSESTNKKLAPYVVL